MILFDISSAFHMATHRLAKEFYNGEKVDLKNHRKEFFKGLLWIIDHHQKLFSQYGDPVICIDERTQPSWRKKMYPQYKSTRKKFRDGQVSFDYADAYILFNEFLNACKEYACLKFCEVPTAEADDIILVVGEYLAGKGEPVLVLSPDKDFIQMQVSPLVRQYSWFTKKMIGPEDKGGMQEWLLEHVCLGDQTDAVPRVVDFQEFNPGVKEYLEGKGIHLTPWEFSQTDYDPEEFEAFGGPFIKPKFGPATLKSLIKKHGSLEALLESSETIKRNYERNRKLVLTEGIPQEVKDKIIGDFNHPVKCNPEGFCKALGLELQDLPEFLQQKYTTLENNLAEFFGEW